MNKNLMAIFHKDFRVGDVVEYKLKPFSDTTGFIGQKIKGKITYISHRVAGVHSESLFEKVLIDELTRTIKFVSLWEVLEKLNERFKNDLSFCCEIDLENSPHNNKLIIEIEYWISQMQYMKDVEWTLSDKSGEVPLHRQSKETQDQLWKILNV